MQRITIAGWENGNKERDGNKVRYEKGEKRIV